MHRIKAKFWRTKFRTTQSSTASGGAINSSENGFPHSRNLQLQQRVFPTEWAVSGPSLRSAQRSALRSCRLMQVHRNLLGQAGRRGDFLRAAHHILAASGWSFTAGWYVRIQAARSLYMCPISNLRTKEAFVLLTDLKDQGGFSSTLKWYRIASTLGEKRLWPRSVHWTEISYPLLQRPS
jgi:hypothetical protein